jgi:hypothetical protein
MRLAWPEKVALVLFGVITLVMLFLGAGPNPDTSEYCRILHLQNPAWTSADSYCFVTAAQHWSAFLSIEGFLFLKIVLPAWIALRVIDLFGGGPRIRRAYREEQAAKSYEGDHPEIDLARNEWRSY